MPRYVFWQIKFVVNYLILICKTLVSYPLAYVRRRVLLFCQESLDGMSRHGVTVEGRRGFGNRLGDSLILQNFADSVLVQLDVESTTVTQVYLLVSMIRRVVYLLDKDRTEWR